MNKKWIIIIISILVILIAGIIILGNRNPIHHVKGDEVRQILNEHKDAVFIDVRTMQEHTENGIDGSMVLPYDQIKSEISSVVPNKNTIVIVYCNTGHRSGIAADTLHNLGYKNVYDMGSYQNW